MAKSPDAFRTISEVAEWLGIQAHVLRFWESKFTQVKPIKRAGGRRYYRPGDMLLLGGIKKLLYEDGLTIKGVQKILREEGMTHVADMSAPLDELTLSQITDPRDQNEDARDIHVAEAPEEPRGVVLSFENAAGEKPQSEAPQDTVIKEESPDLEAAAAPQEMTKESLDREISSTEPAPQEPAPVSGENGPIAPLSLEPEDPKQDVSERKEEPTKPPSEPVEVTVPEPTSERADEPTLTAPSEEQILMDEPSQSPPAVPAPTPEPVGTNLAKEDAQPPTEATADLPAFLRRAAPPKVDKQQPDQKQPNDPGETEAVTKSTDPAEAPPAETAKPEPVAAPKPRQIKMPAITPEAEVSASPALLSAAYRAGKIHAGHAAEVAALLDRLTIHRDSMSAWRKGGNAASPNN